MGNQTNEELYQITVKGALDTRWCDWFGNMELTSDEKGNTTLTGPVADQAALRGILVTIWDLNLAVLAVQRIEQPTD